MGVHSPHPDTLLHGLSDSCDECRVKAADPMSRLDSEHVRDLWCRMVAVEKPSAAPDGYADVRGYRTQTESVATRHLYRVAIFLERHTTIDPWRWPINDRRPLSEVLR